MSISKPKIWMGGGAALCVLLLVASWFLLIQPKHAQASELRDQTRSTAASNEQTRAKIAQLKAQFATLPAKKMELEKVREAMPSQYAEAGLTRELQKLATNTGTTLVSVTNGAPEPFVAPTPDAATPSASASAAATADDSANASKAPAETGPAVSSMPVTVIAQSTFAGSQAYLQKLQDQMPRAFLVTNLTIQAQEAKAAEAGKPATKNGDVLITITGRVFMLDAPDVNDSLTPNPSATTAPATTPAPSATSSAN